MPSWLTTALLLMRLVGDPSPVSLGSYIHRRLQIGYNRAASLMERMELEGIVGPANHAGKREILVGGEEGGY